MNMHSRIMVMNVMDGFRPNNQDSGLVGRVALRSRFLEQEAGALVSYLSCSYLLLCW
jgi:hypothetical protein